MCAGQAALKQTVDSLSKRVSQSSVMATSLSKNYELTPGKSWVDIPSLSVTYNAVDSCLVHISYHLCVSGLGMVQARVVVDNAEPAIKGRNFVTLHHTDTLTATAIGTLTPGSHVIKVQLGTQSENSTFTVLAADPLYESHLVVRPVVRK